MSTDSKFQLKIIPSECTLTKSEQIKCSISGCASTFQSISNLQLHLEKHHRVDVHKLVDNDATVQYYCPVVKCKYNAYEENGKNHFRSRKYLRQHFLKVHATKDVKCTKCDKQFANETLKMQHERVCGLLFKCRDCEWTYSSRESLLTHCRRKKHSIPEFSVKTRRTQHPKFDETKLRSIRSKVETCDKGINCNLDLSIESPAAKIKSNFDKLMKRKRMRQAKKSQTTQTPSLYDVICQTSITENKSNAVSISVKSDSRPNEKYKNLDLIDEESNTLIVDPSQAYKNLNNLNYVEDDSNLNYFTAGNFNSGLCHNETQTELMAFDSLGGTRDMDPLLCHMHTQTCDEILTELGFTDIQTQTNGPDDDYSDLFVSTETQTCFPHLMIDNMSTQTQTANEKNVDPEKMNYASANCENISQCTQTH